MAAAANHTIAGTLGLRGTQHNTTDVIVAFIVVHDRAANNYEVWRAGHPEGADLLTRIDDWHDAGLNIRGGACSPADETWSKYPDEFLSEPAARKYAKRQAAEFVKSHGMASMMYGFDADMGDGLPSVESLNAASPTGTPYAPVESGRFGDADDDFGSRFTRAAAEAAAKARRESTPNPVAVEELNGTPGTHIPADARFENPDSALGGKVWTIMIRNEARSGTTASWHVDVCFGALVNEAKGTGMQTRNVSHCRTRGAAVAVRQERMFKQRKKGYHQVAGGAK